MKQRGFWRTEGPAQYIEENWDKLVSLLGAKDLSVELHMKDSRTMAEIPDGGVQLVVTSPPYPYIEMWDRQFEGALGLSPGTIATSPRHFERCHEYLKAVWSECYRILQPGGLLCVNVGDATRSIGGSFRCYPNHVMVVQGCESLGFTTLIPILWKKPTNKPNSFLGSGFFPSNAYVTLDCEYILLFRRGGKRRFAPKDPLRYASQFSKAERDTWFSQIWAIKGARQNGMAVFPDEIPYRLTRMFSVLGDTVVDPFAGTGQTIKVARSLGRKAIGYEIEIGLEATVKDNVPLDEPKPEDVLEGILSTYGARHRSDPQRILSV